MGMRNGRNKQKLLDVQTRTKEQDTQIDYMTKSSQYLNIETGDLKSLRVYSPCDNLFQSLIDIPLYKKHFFIINGAPYPSLSKNPFSDGQDSSWFLLTRNSDPYTHSHSEFAQYILL